MSLKKSNRITVNRNVKRSTAKTLVWLAKRMDTDQGRVLDKAVERLALPVPDISIATLRAIKRLARRLDTSEGKVIDAAVAILVDAESEQKRVKAK